MNYQPIFDTWFSNPWLSFGIPISVFILVLIFSVRNAKKKKKSVVLMLLLFGVPLGMLMLNGMVNPQYLGYGKSKHIVSVKYMDGQLYITDYLRTMGSKTSRGIKYYRVHIIEPGNGKKIRRFSIGSGAKLLSIL